MYIKQKIKTKLLIRGFSKENLLNNKGLIGATNNELIFEVVKILGIAMVSNQRELLIGFSEYLKNDEDHNLINQYTISAYLESI